ncbi:MAG: hypothetical protein IT236_17450, partial [Bacteroidia bacterium]|nr:hypothetical protein [Bacteroidia bacterium]
MKHLLFCFLFLASLNIKSQDTVKVAMTLSPEQQAELDYNTGLNALKKND